MNDKVMKKLSIPIYLNQRIVFDMLATVEDGISSIKSIETKKMNSVSKSGEIEGLGEGNVFALIKLSLKAKGKLDKKNDDGKTITEEKVYTPVSLFQRLYSSMYNESIIKRWDSSNFDIENFETGDFVEIKGTLSKNPLVAMLDSMIGFGELAVSFNNTNNKKINKAKDKKIISEMKTLSEALKDGNMMDLVCTLNKDNCKKEFKAVLPVHFDNLVNNNMNDIIDGEYRVFGKVVKIVRDDEGSISLLRNTSLSILDSNMMKEFVEQFNKYKQAGLNFNKIQTEINGPAIQIIPIAIHI